MCCVTEPYAKSRPHTHEMWEIGLYTSGSGTAYIGEHSVPYGDGSIICYPPNIPHWEDAPEGCTGYFIATDDCPRSGAPVPTLKDTSEQTLRRICALMYEEYTLRRADWEQAVQSGFELLNLQLRRGVRESHSHPLAEALKQVFIARFGDPEFRPLEAMASLPVSPNYLRTVFVQSTGRTPLQYLTELRVNEARHLLLSGRFSVKEVGLRVGIADPYYFSRVFHKITGIRPSDFSRRAGRSRKL
jgi:AraC-like DNA-binding protein